MLQSIELMSTCSFTKISTATVEYSTASILGEAPVGFEILVSTGTEITSLICYHNLVASYLRISWPAGCF